MVAALPIGIKKWTVNPHTVVSTADRSEGTDYWGLTLQLFFFITVDHRTSQTVCSISMLDNWTYLYGKENKPDRISDTYLDIQGQQRP